MKKGWGGEKPAQKETQKGTPTGRGNRVLHRGENRKTVHQKNNTEKKGLPWKGKKGLKAKKKKRKTAVEGKRQHAVKDVTESFQKTKRKQKKEQLRRGQEGM